MSYVVETMTNLAAQTGFAFLKPGNFIMILVALVFLYACCIKLRIASYITAIVPV